jgi:uncharacterized protein YndB with AHSA1/START domain
MPASRFALATSLLAAILLAAPGARAEDRISRHEVTINRPAADVWNAVATEKGLEQWFAADAVVDLRPGGAIRFTGVAGGEATGDTARVLEVLAHEPGRMIATRLDFPDQYDELENSTQAWSVLSLTPLSPGTTRVRTLTLGLQHGEQWEEPYRFIHNESLERLTRLKSALEDAEWKDPGEDPAPVSVMAVEARIAAPAHEVWPLYSTVEGWQALFVPVAEVDFRLGGTIRTNYDAAQGVGGPGTITHHILAYEPGTMLASRFEVPESAASLKPAEEAWTVISLVPQPDGTTLVRVAMMGLSDDPEDAVVRFFREGNAMELERVRGHFAARQAPAADGTATSTDLYQLIQQGITPAPVETRY